MPYQNEDDGFPAGGGVSGVIGGRLYVVSQCWYVPQSDFWFDNCVPSFFSRYNPATDRWTSLPRPSGSYYRVGGVINGKFYVAGKFYDPSTDQQKPRVEVYDPATNRWTRMTPPTTLGDYGAVMLGKLYTISGRQLRIYNPVTNTVTTRASLPTDRGIVAAAKVFLNGQPRLEVVGGTRPGNNLQYTP